MAPIIVGGRNDTPIPDPRPTVEQQQAAASFDQLVQQRDLLASRRDGLEQQRKRYADDATSGMPGARVQLEKLTGELVAIGVEQETVNTALRNVKRPPDTNSTVAFYQWHDSGGGSGPPGGWTPRQRF